MQQVKLMALLQCKCLFSCCRKPGVYKVSFEQILEVYTRDVGYHSLRGRCSTSHRHRSKLREADIMANVYFWVCHRHISNSGECALMIEQGVSPVVTAGSEKELSSFEVEQITP